MRQSRLLPQKIGLARIVKKMPDCEMEFLERFHFSRIL
jgi:hypothetical protein